MLDLLGWQKTGYPRSLCMPILAQESTPWFSHMFDVQLVMHKNFICNFSSSVSFLAENLIPGLNVKKELSIIAWTRELLSCWVGHYAFSSMCTILSSSNQKEVEICWVVSKSGHVTTHHQSLHIILVRAITSYCRKQNEPHPQVVGLIEFCVK